MQQRPEDRPPPPPPGAEPDETLAPVTCPRCGAAVPAALGGRCPGCGADFDRADRLVEEHGPEAFVPHALPWSNDLSGLALVIEAFAVVSLGLVLLILVYRFFGGWSWTACLFAVGYWTCYGLVRRRSAARTLRALLGAIRLDANDDRPSSAEES